MGKHHPKMPHIRAPNLQKLPPKKNFWISNIRLRVGQFHPQPAPILCCLCFQLLLLPLEASQPFRQLRSRGRRRLGMGLQEVLLVAQLLGPGKRWLFWHMFWPARKMVEALWIDHDYSPWLMGIVWGVMKTMALWNWGWFRASNSDMR